MVKYRYSEDYSKDMTEEEGEAYAPKESIMGRLKASEARALKERDEKGAIPSRLSEYTKGWREKLKDVFGLSDDDDILEAPLINTKQYTDSYLSKMLDDTNTETKYKSFVESQPEGVLKDTIFKYIPDAAQMSNYLSQFKSEPTAEPEVEVMPGLMSRLGPRKILKTPTINVRNNNIGNLKNIKANNWNGQTNHGSTETFASFKTQELGVRATRIVIEKNINATKSFEAYVNRYASEPKEKAYYKKNGQLMPHLVNYAEIIADSQGVDDITSPIPKKVSMLKWIKATAIAEGGEDALRYFSDETIERGIALK